MKRVLLGKDLRDLLRSLNKVPSGSPRGTRPSGDLIAKAYRNS
jgi:hypothetical protein